MNRTGGRLKYHACSRFAPARSDSRMVQRDGVLRAPSTNQLEPPIIKIEGPDDDCTIPPPIRQTTQPPMPSDATSAAVPLTLQHTLHGEAQRDYRTRSGRPIRRPARFCPE